jgi:hypothetical protein
MAQVPAKRERLARGKRKTDLIPAEAQPVKGLR